MKAEIKFLRFISTEISPNKSLPNLSNIISHFSIQFPQQFPNLRKFIDAVNLHQTSVQLFISIWNPSFMCIFILCGFSLSLIVVLSFFFHIFLLSIPSINMCCCFVYFYASSHFFYKVLFRISMFCNSLWKFFFGLYLAIHEIFFFSLFLFINKYSTGTMQWE